MINSGGGIHAPLSSTIRISEKNCESGITRLDMAIKKSARNSLFFKKEFYCDICEQRVPELFPHRFRGDWAYICFGCERLAESASIVNRTLVSTEVVKMVKRKHD
jgi:hypothetical protein